MPKKRLRLGRPGAYREVEVTWPDGEPRPWDADSSLAVVGTRQPRLEGRDKVTGKAQYAADVRLEGMLVGLVLRSPHAKARVTSVGLKKAIALDGVKAAIALDTDILFAGQPVAAVAAVNERVAEDALRLVSVDWEVLEHVTDPAVAEKDGAPRVRGGKNPNVRGGEADKTASEDDCAKALKDSKATVDLTFRTPVVTHSALESHGSVARWEKDGSLTVWDSTQSIFGVRDGLARALQLEAGQVRVIKEHMGGGFGAKLGMGQHSLIAARLAKEAGAPVKVLLTRREEHLAGGNRPSSVQRIRAGADRDGKLTCLWLESRGTGGISGGAACSGPFQSVYRAPVMRLWHADVLTNAGPAQAFRAPGHVQGMFALEGAMDELASKLGMDPIEFRKKNDVNELRRAEYSEGAKVAGWERRNEIRASAPAGKARGIGVAASVWGGQGAPGPQARCTIGRDGSVEIAIGTQDIGTGTRTIVAMVAAEEFGLAPAQVKVRLGDTTLPFSFGSGGSMTAPSITPAVRSAAVKARAELFEACASSLDADAGDLQAARGEIVSPKKKSLKWAEACAKISGASVSAQSTRGQNFLNPGGSAGCQFAEVEVDLETGRVRVLRIVGVHDCGRVINPMLVENQINGGIIQGLSYALFEERVIDHASGRVMNANFTDYRIAGSKEIPKIDLVLFDVSTGHTNTGVVGIGEPPIIPTPGAIANAVSHAIGARMTELPITPARVLKALRKF
jgi:xanthine dehydrogenase YagR molybdenum-binding subunit